MKKISLLTLLIIFSTLMVDAGSVNVTSPTINLGESTTLKAVGYNLDDSFIWKGGMEYREIFSDEDIFHFKPNIAGRHTIELLVNGKSEHNVTIKVNQSPAETHIEAGSDQTICLGDYAELIATAPSDTQLEWRIAGDKYADGPVFYFEPSGIGSYTIDLFGNDENDSLVVTVNNCSTNSRPIANAGVDQTVLQGATVQLDGNASSDPDNDRLTYSWHFTTKPSGSVATLNSPTIVNPSFTADIEGLYTLELIVNDGEEDSIPDSVNIRCNATSSPVPVCIDPTTLTPHFD